MDTEKEVETLYKKTAKIIAGSMWGKSKSIVKGNVIQLNKRTVELHNLTTDVIVEVWNKYEDNPELSDSNALIILSKLLAKVFTETEKTTTGWARKMLFNT